MKVAYLFGKAVHYGLGFALIRYGTNNIFRQQHLLDRHTDGLCGDVVYGLKPSPTKLLRSAYRVEIDYNIGIFYIKIGRGIVKGQMSVFAYSYKCQVDWIAADYIAQPFALFFRILCFAVDEVYLPECRQAVDKPFS